MIDTSLFDKRNIWVNSAGEQVVRQGMQQVFSSFGLGGSDFEFYGGFSAQNKRTGDQVHYVLAGAEDTYLYLLNEEFFPLSKVYVGRGVRPDGPFQGGVLQNGQLLMGAPGMPMYWGYVGAGFKKAEKTNSGLDIDFSTITIPDGLVAAWQGRIVLGVRDALFFSDPLSPRAFLAGNVVATPGLIYFLEVSQAGQLYMGTTNGVYIVAADTVASGSIVQPIFQKVSEFPINKFFQCALTTKGPVALSPSGVVSVSNFVGEELLLGDQRVPRTLGDPIHFEDYTVGRIFKMEDGPIITLAAEQDLTTSTYLAAKIHERRNFYSWISSSKDSQFQESLEVRGILQDSNGDDFILTDKEALKFFGNVDSQVGEPTGRFVIGTITGTVPAMPEMNPVVRSITTLSDNTGTLQYASIQGVQKSATPFRETSNIPVCDETSWYDSVPGASNSQYYTRRLQSIRHRFSVRTNDLGIQVGVEGSGFRIGLVDVRTKGPGQRRPQDGTALVPSSLAVD